ncbi:cytochrome P450 [Permianibacter aggregans]|uniref:Cytochrome P450 n=1 Tax=Permianibacter aggregans TaxID=1510150 RepID=A0A4R6UMG1_9GAMM|nr:cytochrome P450 [Permianibacter aggregans]QGX40900.1 cytochrome P450 [Permianibacter aggregans]TDQ48280.1 cytochrome P450 [Permianibacter aggregans]
MAITTSIEQVPSRKISLGLSLLRHIQHDPLGAAKQLQQQYGDVAKLNILFRRIYYFFSPEAARQILVDHQSDFVRESRQLKVFASFQGKNVLTTEGADWDRQRRILTPGFSPKRVAGYMDLMNAAIHDSVSAELPVEPGKTAVVDADFLTTRVTMDVILRTLFSYATTQAEAAKVSIAIRALSRQSMRELFWPIIPPKWLPYPGRAAKLEQLKIIHTLIDEHIQARTSTNTDSKQDVLSMLLAARDDQPGAGNASLSAQEIHDNCFVLFAAGFDTASSAMSWWIGLMATHPGIVEQLRQEITAANTTALESIARLPLLNATIKEAMRLYPPSTALFTRVAQKDVVIGDTPVAKNTLVVIPIWNLHHDARSFAEPNVFRPERFLPDAPAIPRGAYLPFGAGPHFCLGQHFASIEMALIAAHLIQHFDFALAEGETLPEPVVDLVLKPKSGLRVRVTRR